MNRKVVYLNNWYWINVEDIESGYMPAYISQGLTTRASINGKPLVFTQLPNDESIEYIKLPQRSRK